MKLTFDDQELIQIVYEIAKEFVQKIDARTQQGVPIREVNFPIGAELVKNSAAGNSRPNQSVVTPTPAMTPAVSVAEIPVAQAPVVPTSPAAPVATAPMSAGVPTTQISYTMDDLAKAGAELMDKGRQAELLNLLNQFGVLSLPQLQPEQYGAFATALRGLGAKI